MKIVKEFQEGVSGRSSGATDRSASSSAGLIFRELQTGGLRKELGVS